VLVRRIAFIGLGANLGQAQVTLAQACAALDQAPGCRVTAVSSWWRSVPVDADGPDYVNGVAQLETDLEPEMLLGTLQALERDFGRQRSYRNAPRTLDLDVLLYDAELPPGLCLRTPRLQLPHPRLMERAFVLHPLLELLPTLSWPGVNDVAALCARLAVQQGIERLSSPRP
jgi:2-amino-4-hydroxy-6-hydroxymethyldihydropteridine diphosphokinase